METLRKRFALDRVLMTYLRKPDNLPNPVRNSLRLGALQLLCYESIPEYASVKATVELIKEKRFKNLANAILRRIASKRDVHLHRLLEVPDAFPEWLKDHWQEMDSFVPSDELMKFFITQGQDAYLLDESQLQALTRQGISYVRSSVSGAVYLTASPGKTLRSERVDEVSLMLNEELDIPVMSYKGCLSSLENKPWLLHTVSHSAAMESGKKAFRLIEEFADRFSEGIYYTDSMTYYETVGAVSSCSCMETDEVEAVLLSKRIEFSKKGKGIWLMPGLPLKPAFIFCFRRM